MAAHLIEPGHAIGSNGDEPGRDRVIVLSDWRPPMAPGRTAAGSQGGAPAAIYRFGLHFTVADHAALGAWASGTGHGYDRLRVDRGVLEGGNWVSYALVYVPGQAWSTWGLTRRNDHIEVWRCATGQTVGRHARMADALASLPHATDHRWALPMDAGRTQVRTGPRQHRTR